MSKINKNSINFAFKTLALLAFSLLIIPASVSAYDNGGTNYVFENEGGIYNGPSNSTNTGQSPTANNPKPVITSISPNSATKNVSAKTVTITGRGFTPSSVARVNNVNRITTFIDPTHLFIQLNSSDMSRNDGGFFVTVWNQAPGGGYSNAVYFTLKAPAPAVKANTNSNNSNNSSVNTTESYNNNQNTDSYSNLASNAIFGSNSFLPSGLIQWVLIAIIILLLIIIVRKLFGAEDHYHSTPLKHS
jgi:hypothetical protein